MKHYYFGYGMNTDRNNMAIRCPNSVDLGKAKLHNFKFRFQYHADIIEDNSSHVDGVLWEITDNCLKKLDMLEGYPIYYDRKKLNIEQNGKIYHSWVYFMTEKNPDIPPSKNYLTMLINGYKEHQIDVDILYKSINNIRKNY